MIFEAFSGSKFLILERTTFVASHEPITNQTFKGSQQEMKWRNCGEDCGKRRRRRKEEERTEEDDVFVVCYHIP